MTLDVRARATVRAALRLFQRLRGEIDRDALAAAHAEILDVGEPDEVILRNAEIEPLLTQFALADSVVLTMFNAEAIDRRRV